MNKTCNELTTHFLIEYPAKSSWSHVGLFRNHELNFGSNVVLGFMQPCSSSEMLLFPNWKPYPTGLAGSSVVGGGEREADGPEKNWTKYRPKEKKSAEDSPSATVRITVARVTPNSSRAPRARTARTPARARALLLARENLCINRSNKGKGKNKTEFSNANYSFNSQQIKMKLRP